MDIEKNIRDLAKSYKYQTISSGGENPFYCFENKSDYNYCQVLFMSYLKFYSVILSDIAEEEVDEIVTTDNIYEDAYMYWRNKFKYKKIKNEISNSSIKFPPMTKQNKPVKEKQELSSFKWSFKSKNNGI